MIRSAVRTTLRSLRRSDLVAEMNQTVIDRRGQSVWCRLQTSGAWQRGIWMCSNWCTGRRAVGREHSPEELQCWSYGCWMRILTASLATACLSGSWWSTGGRCQFILKGVRDDGVKSGADVYKQEPHRWGASSSAQDFRQGWCHTVWAWCLPSLDIFVEWHIIFSYLQCRCGGEGDCKRCEWCFFKPAIELIQIVCLLLILQSAGGWCFLTGDVFHTFPHWSRITGR